MLFHCRMFGSGAQVVASVPNGGSRNPGAIGNKVSRLIRAMRFRFEYKRLAVIVNLEQVLMGRFDGGFLKCSKAGEE